MGFVIFLLSALSLVPSCRKGPAGEVFVGRPSSPYQVELRLDPSPLVAGQQAMLPYTVEDEVRWTV